MRTVGKYQRMAGLPALVAFGATLCFAGPASAFCRATTMTFQSDPTTTGSCGATEGEKALFWEGLCVGYSVQKDASRQVSFDAVSRVAAEAFAAWTSVDCPGGGKPSLAAQDNGASECSEQRYNSAQRNQNLIVFRDDAWPYPGLANALGLTTLSFSKDTGEIWGADIEINSSDHLFSVDAEGPPGSFDLRAVLTHEVGHFLGLAHSETKDAIMYAKYEAALGARLTQDDQAAICSVYGPSNSRATSQGTLTATECNATPKNGFSSACADPATDTTSGPAVAENSGGCGVGAVQPNGWRSTGLLLGLVLLVTQRNRSVRFRLGSVGRRQPEGA